MMLAHPLFENPIEFDENKINVLVIENKTECAKLIQELIYQTDGAAGQSVLSEDYKEISFSTVDVVADLFRLDVNSRKNINKLLNILSEYAMNEKYYAESCEITGKICEYAQRIADDSDYDLTLSEIKTADIFKLCDVKFEIEKDSTAERLLAYLKVMRGIGRIRLFVFVGLKQFFSVEELKKLYKDFLYEKYSVLLIETSACDSLELENVKIIDNDLCEIT